jgi:putative phosphoesterase
MAGPLRVGIISDTHGLLRPEALLALQGSDHIVHAGDIGDATILHSLAAIAPVTAVRGNNDTAPWALEVLHAAFVRVGAIGIYVLHDAKELPHHPAPADAAVLVFGHSHKPLVQRQADGRLWVNPGSAGPRRFKLPVTVARLHIGDGGTDLEAHIVELALH